ncbi:MAG TPA: PAS domain S-box protein, partial [Bacillota bacterium]|nr:PAS domain S-box protein [Bacillota bacterium]
MTFLGILSLIAGALQLTVPSYALRLVRLFGTRPVGWFLVAAFSSLALVHLLKPLAVLGAGPTAGVSLELVCALASMLLLIGMGHMEILLSERQQAQRQEQRRRSEWERQVNEQTANLTKANQELLQEIALRAQAHQTLQESEAQYRFLFLEHPQPVWIFDLRSFRFLAVNQAALRLCGFTAQEFLALTVRELLPSKVVPAFLQDAAKPCTTATFRGLWPCYKKDRTLVEVEMTALDLRYDQCPARLILATDVSLRQQRERDSRQAQKMKIIRQVAAGVAHHFSDLLTRVDNQIHLVLQKPQDPKVPEQLQQISAAANRAAALNRQLLIIGGRHPITKELLDINGLLENLTPMIRR